VSKQKKKASSGTEDSESDRYPVHGFVVPTVSCIFRFFSSVEMLR
jgi:hypothetical protein